MTNRNNSPRPRLTEFMIRGHDLAVALDVLKRWDTLSEEELIALGFGAIPASDFERYPAGHA
jgi:hypothetical protein